MEMGKFLNTTNRNCIWFKKEHDEGNLVMKPPFQRNPVWVERQKSYLIDSILNGFPIPEIYMQDTVSAEGDEKYIIVDGQQRIRSVLEFMEGEFPIDPVDSPDWADMFFEDLSGDDKKKIYKYNFVIRVLPELDDVKLRDIFKRLNRNVVALNKQELRQATYWGPFIQLMNKLSDKKAWGEIDLFTPNDVRRMLDVEFISELSIAILNGPQNKKQSLDKYYELYEQEFEEYELLEEIFIKVLNELPKLLPENTKSRWRKKTDFYTLFTIFAGRYDDLPLSRRGREMAREKLIEFDELIKVYVKAVRPQGGVDLIDNLPPVVIHYGSGIRASTDLGSRKRRYEALEDYLSKIWES